MNLLGLIKDYLTPSNYAPVSKFIGDFTNPDNYFNPFTMGQKVVAPIPQSDVISQYNPSQTNNLRMDKTPNAPKMLPQAQSAPQQQPQPTQQPMQGENEWVQMMLRKGKNSAEYYRNLYRKAVTAPGGKPYQQPTPQPTQQPQVMGAQAPMAMTVPTPTLVPGAPHNPYMGLIQQYFPQDQWNAASNVMFGESGFRPGAYNTNEGITGTVKSVDDLRQILAQYPRTDVGPYQINSYWQRDNLPKAGFTIEDMLEPEKAVQFAAWLQAQNGWNPWLNPYARELHR
jgi:hypothetical protein